MIRTARRLFFSSLKVCIKLVVTTLFKLKLDGILSIFMGTIIILCNKNEIYHNKKKFGILAIKKLIFNEDIKILKKYPSNYKILFFPYPLKNSKVGVLGGMWPEEIQKQTEFYTKKDKYESLFERCSKLFYDTLDFIERVSQVEVKIILTANIDYWQDYPWIATIHKKNGKFVVLGKESILYSSDITKRRFSRLKEYGFIYEGDAVLFYNELAKKTYVSSGVVKINQSFVTGCPRVDILTSLAKNKKSNEKFILFATFMTSLHGAAKSVKLGNEILDLIYQDELLREKTIIKCKNSREERTIGKKYPGLCVVSGPIEKYLKKNPAIFVGFNSTSCLDALIARIPTVVPWWGDAKKVGKGALLGEHTSDFHLIGHNKESLKKILKEHTSNNQSYKEAKAMAYHPKLKKIVEKKYSPIDGMNCQRFFKVIDKLVLDDRVEK